MGDRTTVSLTVLTSQKAEAEKIALAAGYEADSVEDNKGLSCFLYYEVNYGELSFLPELTAAGIAHDSDWDHGGDYTAGSEFMRFTPEGETKGYSYSNEHYNPDLAYCLTLVGDPAQLVQYILDHKDKVTPLPWDNQEAFGKIYRTKQLLT
jgi:hypothetical protein